ncbi:MAG TPA: peptide-methionine (R)-S-oxide reductase MsrB [Caulobacteraceae bacterium]
MATSDTTILKTASGFDLAPPSADERAVLEAGLSQEEREVLLRHGTEAPFCGGLLGNKHDGVYCCRLCGLPLFRAQAKFESGTGWPSFWAPYDEGHIRSVRDFSHGMIRIETRCARCDSHQGHMFPDGPPPTGLRYCINSVSLNFVADGQPLPDPLKRGDALP